MKTKKLFWLIIFSFSTAFFIDKYENDSLLKSQTLQSQPFLEISSGELPEEEGEDINARTKISIRDILSLI